MVETQHPNQPAAPQIKQSSMQTKRPQGKQNILTANKTGSNKSHINNSRYLTKHMVTEKTCLLHILTSVCEIFVTNHILIAATFNTNNNYYMNSTGIKPLCQPNIGQHSKNDFIVALSETINKRGLAFWIN